VNLAGVRGDAETDPKGLFEDEEWDPPGDGSGRGLVKELLENAFLVNSERYF